nr:ABC transporter permease [uncultured Cohaesibacter sp.]
MSLSRLVRLALNQSTLVFFIIMLVVAEFLSDRFFTGSNISNVLRQTVPLGIVSIGLLFVILTSGIDLSVGSLMALVSVAVALFIPQFGLTAGIIMALLVGLVCGAFSGVLVTYFSIAPFIATLATMTIARGLALIFSRGQPIFIESDFFMNVGTSTFMGIPTLFVILVLVVLIAWFVYRYAVFGRLVVAVGSNETATRFAGINVSTIKLAVYALSGLTCGIAGIISATRTGVGSPILAVGFELDAIAAVVVGGASLNGGRGTVFNTLMGAMILSIISNLMNLMDIPGYHQQVVKGIIIVLAVLLESAKQRFAKSI